MTLALHELADALGISSRAVVELAQRDRRVIASPSSPGALFRLRRWLEAGKPIGDPREIAFRGDDGIRDVVIDMLSGLPHPVRHYAIECVTFFEVGRGTAAWIGRAITPRALPGDVGHVIVINGRSRNEDLRGVIAHELGHGWHRAIVDQSAPPLPTLSEREAMAARILFASHTASAEQLAADAEQWIRAHVADELLADQQAEAWGVPHNGPTALELRRHFTAAHAAATSYALELDPGIAIAAAIEGAP